METFEDCDFPRFDFNYDLEATASTESSTTTRFANLSETELQKILLDKQSERTKKTTNWCVSTFKGKVFIQVLSQFKIKLTSMAF